MQKSETTEKSTDRQPEGHQGIWCQLIVKKNIYLIKGKGYCKKNEKYTNYLEQRKMSDN